MRKLLVLGLLLGVFASAIAAAVLLLGGDSAPPSVAGANRIIIAGDVPDSFSLDESTFASHGITAANSWSDAVAAADEATKAIIFAGPTALAGADRKWVTDRMDRIGEGFVVGGLNVSQVELGTAFDRFGPPPQPEGAEIGPDPLDDGSRFGNETFYSLLYYVRSSDGLLSRGGTNEEFDSVDRFLANIERFIGKVEIAGE